MSAMTIRLGALMAGAVALLPQLVSAADPVSLFKVVTVRDEITVGFTGDELAALGTAPALELVADRLARAGYVVTWQYASGRGADGSLRQVPVRRIALYSGGVVRVEPLKTDQPIDPPKP